MQHQLTLPRPPLPRARFPFSPPFYCFPPVLQQTEDFRLIAIMIQQRGDALCPQTCGPALSRECICLRMTAQVRNVDFRIQMKAQVRVRHR